MARVGRRAPERCSSCSPPCRSARWGPRCCSRAGSPVAVLAITPLVVPGCSPASARRRRRSPVLEARLARALLGARQSRRGARAVSRRASGGSAGDVLPTMLPSGAGSRSCSPATCSAAPSRSASSRCSRSRLAAIAEPIYYRWSSPDIGSWHVDTLGRALVFRPRSGSSALVARFYLLGPLGDALRAARGRCCSTAAGDRSRPGLADAPRSRRRALAVTCSRFGRDRGGGRHRLGATTHAAPSGRSGCSCRSRSRSASTAGSWSCSNAAEIRRDASDAGGRDPGRLCVALCAVPRRRVGRQLGGGYFWPVWAMLARWSPSSSGRAALARPRRRLASASRCSRRRAPAPSTRRTPSCGGSSATSTTAPRPGSSRSA